MLSAWVECGLDPDAFWRQTPRLIKLTITARMRALENQHNDRAWAMWYGAALTRTNKRFPPLTDFLSSKQAPERRRRQTWQQQRMVAQWWTAALGGEFVTANRTDAKD